MILFVDASALVAIVRNEPDGLALGIAASRADRRIISGLALWETMRAVAKNSSVEVAAAETERFRRSLDIQVVPIGALESIEAFRAHARYGKGTGHPARLNMGDCFAYACARTNGARLLYKGDDFSHTDMAG